MVALNSMRCIKWLIFIFNFLFFVTGSCLIGFALWLKVSREDWQAISEFAYISIANVAIVTGCIIVMVAFLGCCGAITENKIMMLLFFLSLLVIFLMEIGTGITAYIYRNQLQTELKAQLEERIPGRYYKEIAIEKAVNEIQEHFKCCGLYDIEDWGKSTNADRKVDESCCIMESGNAGYNSNCLSRPWNFLEANPALKAEYYKEGCYDKIEDFIQENMWLAAVLGFTFAGVEIIGMVFSMVLYCVLRKQDNLI